MGVLEPQCCLNDKAIESLPCTAFRELAIYSVFQWELTWVFGSGAIFLVVAKYV